MAEPTIDSKTGQPGLGLPPAAGPGSKTPPTPGLGLGVSTPLGGAPKVKPQGEPGRPENEDTPPRPKTPDEISDDALTTRSEKNFVRTLSQILDESQNLISEDGKSISSNKITKLIDELLDRGWTEDSLKNLINKSEMEPKEFFKAIAKSIKTSGEQKTIDLLDKKLNPPAEPAAPGGVPGAPAPMGAPAPGGPPPPPGGGAPPPPVGAPPVSGPAPGAPPPIKANITDVDLNNKNFNTREGKMSKVIVTKEGTLEEVSDNRKEVLSKLVLAIRNTKSAISNVEEQKLRYAGVVALKFAAKEMEFGKEKPFGDEDGDKEGLEGEEDLDLGGLDEEEGEDGDMDKERILDGLDMVKDGIKSIEEAIKGVEKEMGEEDGEVGPEEFNMADNLLGKAEATIRDAREVIKIAKKDIETIGKKSKGKDSQKAMNMAMGKKSAFNFDKKKDEGKDKDKKKDDKDKEKDEKEKDKKAADTDELIKRVKARLAGLREEKEANLYPFKDLAGAAAKVDNTNQTSAQQQISTADSEIKKQPVQDKNQENMNHGDIGQADLSYTTEGKNAEGKKVTEKGADKVSSETSNMIRNAVDKAKLSVELAATQQLRGLIDNPLKQAFVKNMVEAGISEDLADTIAHNAFIDGYEDSQKIIMKEAFETFMAKPYQDFVKVAKFTTEYVPREDVLASVEDEENRSKEASSTPLRGTKTDSRSDDYKKFWQDVERNRRGF